MTDYTPRTCDRCDKDLTPQHDGCEHHCMWHREVEPEQWDNALVVKFDGGYGMFVDPIEREFSAVLCHECAHQLLEQEPWMRKAIGDPLLSHSHREGSVSAEHSEQQRVAWAASSRAHEARQDQS